MKNYWPGALLGWSLAGILASFQVFEPIVVVVGILILFGLFIFTRGAER